MTSIIIPCTDIIPDGAQLLDALLFSITHGGVDYPVAVCYDACSDSFVQAMQLKYPQVHPLINTGNRLNFAGNANVGLRWAYAKGDNAIVVNQDCILPSKKHVDRISGAGLAVPTAVKVCGEPPISAADLDLLQAQQSEVFMWTPQVKLIGFCMYFDHTLMTKVGFFDESFKASFEDDDICVRAALAGFPVEHVNVAVHHYVSRCGAYDGQRLQVNLIKFKHKWGIPDEVTDHAGFNQWILDHHEWQDAMREA